MHLDRYKQIKGKTTGGVSKNAVDIGNFKDNSLDALIDVILQVCLFEMHYLG